MNERVKQLEGKLIVSCQALPHEPLHSSFIMGRMALAAYEGGAVGIRANTKEDIAEIQKQVDLPVIGIVKRDYEDCKVYITPTMKEIDELMEVKPEIIAIDATINKRPGGESLDKFFSQVKEKYPGQLFMADCSTVEEALHADEIGFDFIGTTLVGYTDQSRKMKIEENDFEILRQIIAGVKHPVIAEGNINTPEKAKRVIELGAFSVVVGSIITRPQLITKAFSEVLQQENKAKGRGNYINNIISKRKGEGIMRNLDKYKGVIPAFYACYDKEGNISPEGVQALTRYFIDKGVKGVYVNGSSGECIYQSVADKKIVLENVMKANEGQLTVIAHVACNNTKDSMELAAHAESLGVDAIAAIPPIYFRLPEYAIAEYWNDISSAAPNTDFIIYNIPQLAGVALTMGLFAEMRKNPRVVGVKNSSMPVQDIQMFKDAGGDDYVIFNGPDEQFMSGRVIGAEGGIGGTYGAMPELFLKLDEYVRACKMDEARELQYTVNAIIYKMCSAHGNMYGVIKEILKLNEGLELGGVRKPLPFLIESDMVIVKEAAQMIMDAKAKFVS